MEGKALYYAISLIGYLISGGIFWTSWSQAKRIRVRKKPWKAVKDLMVRDIDVDQANEMIRKSGIKGSILHYQIIRYAFCFGNIFLNFATAISNGRPVSLFNVVMFMILFFVTVPKTSVAGIKSPFKRAADALMDYNRQKIHMELYRAVCQLKNLAITKADRPPGFLFIIEQMKKFSKLTKPIFTQVESLWIQGQKDEACDYLRKTIGSKEAEAFASILRKIEDLNPIELRQQMVLLLEVIRRTRETERINQNKVKSTLIYVVVTTSFMTIFLNFITVAVFIDMLNDLGNI